MRVNYSDMCFVCSRSDAISDKKKKKRCDTINIVQNYQISSYLEANLH